MIDFDQISLNIKNKTYPLIGIGSGRLVYDMNNGFAVKMAKNRRGLAQNKVEQKIASVDQTGIFARVTDVSENFTYLIMEKAEKVHYMSEVLNYYHVKNNHELFRLDEFTGIYEKYGLLIPDLYRPTNWGMVKGRPVIVDYGFTQAVKRKYYSFKLNI